MAKTPDTSNIWKKVPCAVALHRILLDASGEPEDFEYLDVNPAFAEMLGKPPEQIVGTRFSQLVPHPHPREKEWITLFGKVARNGGEEASEAFSPRLQKWFSTRVISSGDGFFTTVYQDITAQKLSPWLTNPERQKSWMEFSKIQQLAHLGTWDADLQTRQVSWSEELFRICGLPVTGDSVAYGFFRTLVHPQDRDRWDHLVASLHCDSLEKEVTLRIIWPNKQVRHVLIKAIVERDLSGTPLHIRGYVLDRTESLSALEEAQDTQKKLHFYLEKAPFGIAVTNEEGTVLDINPAGCFLTGYTQEEVLQRNFLELVGPESLSTMRDLMMEYAEKGNCRGEVSFSSKDGQTKLFDFESVRLSPEVSVNFFRDVSKARKMERELKEALEEAESASRAKTAFLANMSHELRTPMNGVFGYLSLLESTPVTPEQKEFLSSIRFSARTLLELIDRLLDISRIEAGKMELENLPFHPLELGRQCLNSFQQQAQSKKLQLHMQMEEWIPPALLGDPSKIQQVLGNLLSNALKFSPSGTVVLGVQPLGTPSLLDPPSRKQWLRFEVSDTGIGIPSEMQEAIFQPFVQVDDNLTRKYGGSGLGLAIAEKLVRLMGGKLHVESEEGKGSRFFFDLPFSVWDEENPQQRNLASFEAGFRFARIPGEPGVIRGLIVEDDVVSARFLQTLLQTRGFECFIAENGKEALEILQQKNVDVVFMDCQMPRMDGFQAAEKIREREKATGSKTHLPIIAVTAYALRSDRERALSAGMDAYIAKPVEPLELFEILESLFPVSPFPPREQPRGKE